MRITTGLWLAQPELRFHVGIEKLVSAEQGASPAARLRAQIRKVHR